MGIIAVTYLKKRAILPSEMKAKMALKDEIIKISVFGFKHINL